MDTPTVAAKSRVSNMFEGVTLTAALLGLPTFTGVALLDRLAFDLGISGNHHDNVIFFVIMTSLLCGLVAPFLARKFQLTAFYEPLFFDASLSLSDKFARWRTQPLTSLRLLTMLLMLSVLALAVLSVD